MYNDVFLSAFIMDPVKNTVPEDQIDIESASLTDIAFYIDGGVFAAWVLE